MIGFYLLLALAGFLFIAALFRLIGLLAGAPVISSDRRVIRVALQLASLKPREKLIDIGCGWGRVLQIARKQFGARVYGVEVSPIPWLVARLRFKNVCLGTISAADLKKYNLVYAYLMPGIMRKSRHQLEKAIAQGARVVSVSFPIPNLTPAKTASCRGYTIYLYR